MVLAMNGKIDLKGKFSSSKAFSKASKISEAQQYMLIAVFGASIFLGVAIAMVAHFANQIAFNARVIAEEEKNIVILSDTIKDIGICQKPKGRIYSNDELKSCKPNDIDATSVPSTLRSNILQVMAANTALNSVPKEDLSYCVNTETSKNFTYDEMNKIYSEAISSNDTAKIAAATELIQACSALRVIPDAIPSYRNEEALLSSLNRIFIISNWEPESLSPTGTYELVGFGNNLYRIPIRLAVDADAATTKTVLNNIERSIREFDISRAAIEWSGENSFALNAELKAYYTVPSTVFTRVETVKYVDTNKKSSTNQGGN